MAELISSAHNPKIKQLLSLQEKSKLRRELGLFVVEGVREIERCVEAGFEADSLFVCPEIAEPRKWSEGFASAFEDFRVCGTGLLDSPLADSRGQGTGLLDSPLADSREQGTGLLDSPLADSRGHGTVYTGFGSETFKVENRTRKARIFEVTKEIYSKIAYRESTEGIIAEFKTKDLRLQDLKLSPSPLLIVLESVEKPGNLGAVLRSADAAGADAVLICDPLTDLYNPNLIRASLGARFSVQCSACTSSEAIKWLKAKGIRILTAQLQDSSWYYNTDMTKGTAIVIGTESCGLSDSWRNSADAHIKIPMLGTVDSLNASVSAAILLFEAVRQRNSL